MTMILEDGFDEDTAEERYEIRKDPNGVMGPRLDVKIFNSIGSGSDTVKDYQELRQSIRWSDDELESMVDEIYSAISDVVEEDSIRVPDLYRKMGLGNRARNMRSVHDVLSYDSMDGIVRYDCEKVISRIDGDDIFVPDSFDMTIDFYNTREESLETIESRAENLLEKFRRIGESY